MPFVVRSNRPCTYDRLDFHGFQRNPAVARGPGWAAYLDNSRDYDELTIIFFDPETSIVSGIIVTGPGGALPGKKRLISILEALGPQLADSLAGVR